MSSLQTLGLGQGFLKAGFLGFQKSGKSYTAILLAIAVRQLFGLKGPIGMFDTEGGSEYVAPLVREATGMDLVGLRSRSFDELVNVTRDAESEGISVMIGDSMTHVWRDLCKSYLYEVNESRTKQSLLPRNKLVMNDWNILKQKWEEEFTAAYLNSKLHYIVCGRAGYIFDFEEDEEDGHKELIKTGIKMKTEGEFGYEPSLVVLMEQIQNLRPRTEVTEKVGGRNKKRFRRPRAGVAITRQATVIGDRFSVIDGAQTTFATHQATDRKKVEKELVAVADFFGPHLRLLRPGAHAPIDTTSRSVFGVDEGGNAAYYRERVQREVICEEIQGEIVAMYPGQTAIEKKAKADLINEIFNTRSWTRVEKQIPVAELRAGLKEIRGRTAATASVIAEAGFSSIPPASLNGGAPDEAIQS